MLRFFEVRMEPADLPRFDLRTLTSLKTLALGAVGNAMVCLAPDLEDLDLTLEMVGDLDRVLQHVDLGHVRRLNLNVGLAVSSFSRWERLCAQLVRVAELVLPYATFLGLSRKRLGPEFRALLGRVRRLDLVCAGSADFLQSVLEATGPALRSLVLRQASLTQRISVQIPWPVRAGLEYFQVEDEVLIPARPSLSPPEDFLRAQVARAFE